VEAAPSRTENTNTLAYCGTELITAVNSFKEQAPGVAIEILNSFIAAGILQP